jgi:hypothetical protein
VTSEFMAGGRASEGRERELARDGGRRAAGLRGWSRPRRAASPAGARARGLTANRDAAGCARGRASSTSNPPNNHRRDRRADESRKRTRAIQLLTSSDGRPMLRPTDRPRPPVAVRVGPHARGTPRSLCTGLVVDDAQSGCAESPAYDGPAIRHSGCYDRARTAYLLLLVYRRTIVGILN